MKNRNIFQQIWFLRWSNYNSKPILTCYNKSDALSHDIASNLTHNIIRENTDVKKEIDQDRILRYFRVSGTLRR